MRVINKFISAFLCIVLVFSAFSVCGFSVETTTGNIANLIVCVRFSDAEEDRFETDTDKIIKLYDDSSDLYQLIPYDFSFKAYINEISRGKLVVNNFFPQKSGDVIVPLTLSSVLSESDDFSILNEVINAFNDGKISLPDGKLDYRTSGIIDNLTVILQGSREDANSDVMWPHKSICQVLTQIKNKYYVGNYNFINTWSLLDSATMQGTISHEFLHTLGLPDLYRKGGLQGIPVGRWDIMASDSMYQQYPLSYQRYQLGWVPMQTISQSGDYILDNVKNQTSDSILFKLETPLSTSEFFMLEYRFKDPDYGYYDSRRFEARIPSSGLLIYRVNNNIEYHTNSLGEDYLYVFRPDETSLTGSGGDITQAAIDPDAGETTYGNADMTAEFTDNTIFYSDGTNSGIVISDIAYIDNGEKLSFHVEFPDYSSLDLWDSVGSSLSSGGAYKTDGATDDSGNKYLLSIDSTGATVSTFKDGAWVKAAPVISKVQDACIEVFNNELYMIYLNSSGYPVVAKIVNGAWVTIATDTSASYPISPQLFKSDDELYCGWAKDSTTLVIKKVNASSLTAVNSSLTAQYFSNPELSAADGYIYAIYSDFFGSDKTVKLKRLNIKTGVWENFAIPNAPSGTNVHKAAYNNGELWFLAAGYGIDPIVISLKNNGDIITKTVSTDLTNFLNIGIDINSNGTLFVGLFTSQDKSEVLYLENGEWKKLGSNPCDSIQTADMFVYEDTVYVASSSVTGGYVIVRSKEMPYLPSAQLLAKEGTSIKITDGFISGVPLSVIHFSLYLDVTEDGYYTFDGTGTGSKLYLYSADSVLLKIYTVVVNGDVNSDNSIDGRDAVIISAVIAGMSGFSDEQILAADADNDGILTTEDFAFSEKSGVFL